MIVDNTKPQTHGSCILIHSGPVLCLCNYPLSLVQTTYPVEDVATTVDVHNSYIIIYIVTNIYMENVYMYILQYI